MRDPEPSEEAWLAEKQPLRLLEMANFPQFSEDHKRKLRLLMCRAARLLPHLDAEVAYIDAAERRADGDRAAAPPHRISRHHRLLWLWAETKHSPWNTSIEEVAIRWLTPAHWDPLFKDQALARAVRDLRGNPRQTVRLRHLGNALCRHCRGSGHIPFRYPPRPCPYCTCITPLVKDLARAAHDSRGPEANDRPTGLLDPVCLAILADALEDAGCSEPRLLAHLREPGGEHLRGCWALDLLLGKET